MYRLSKPCCFYVLYMFLFIFFTNIIHRCLYSTQPEKTSSCVDDLIQIYKLIHYTPPKGRSAMKIYLLENVMARVHEMEILLHLRPLEKQLPASNQVRLPQRSFLRNPKNWEGPYWNPKELDCLSTDYFVINQICGYRCVPLNNSI